MKRSCASVWVSEGAVYAAAELELDEAIVFYEKRCPGLSRPFLKEVAHAVSLIETSGSVAFDL